MALGSRTTIHARARRGAAHKPAAGDGRRRHCATGVNPGANARLWSRVRARNRPVSFEAHANASLRLSEHFCARTYLRDAVTEAADGPAVLARSAVAVLEPPQKKISNPIRSEGGVAVPAPL